MPSPPSRSGPPPWALLLLPLVASALLRDLWAPDEPRRAQVALEMWQGRDLLVPRLCGDLYPDKPPLLFWLIIPLGVLSGWQAWALRLVPIACMALTAWLVGRLARSRAGEEAARWSACLFLGFAFVTFEGGRLNIDPLLTLLCTGALVTARIGPESLWTRALLAGGLTGLAALAKGPVAFANVGLVLVGWWLVVDGRPRLRPAPLLAGALLAVLPVATWAALASWVEPAMAQELFYGQHVGRVVRAEDHPGPLWQNATRVPLLLLPWTPLVFLGLLRARAGRDLAWREPAVWLTVLFVFFSVLPVKRDLYLFPAYPAAALLGGQALASALQQGSPSSPGRWLRWPGTLVLVLLGAALLGAAPFALQLEERADLRLPLAVVGLPLLAGSIHALRAADGTAWARRLLFTWAITFCLVGLVLMPAIDPLKSARGMARVLAERPERPQRIPCLGVQPEGYRHYGGVPTVRDDDLLQALEREGDQFLGLVREREWDRLEPDVQASFQVLHRGMVGSKPLLLLGAPAPAGAPPR